MRAEKNMIPFVFYTTEETDQHICLFPYKSKYHTGRRPENILEKRCVNKKNFKKWKKDINGSNNYFNVVTILNNYFLLARKLIMINFILMIYYSDTLLFASTFEVYIFIF